MRLVPGYKLHFHAVADPEGKTGAMASLDIEMLHMARFMVLKNRKHCKV